MDTLKLMQNREMKGVQTYMKRVSDPKIREQQMIEAAMKLFCEKGYENTSMADIAGEMGVVKGLCYRYFDSKQELFESVIGRYIKECCEGMPEKMHDRSMTAAERLVCILQMMLSPERQGRYHDFFHKKGNESMHDRVVFGMCEELAPHLAEEIDFADVDKSGGISSAALSRAVMYGMAGIWQGENMSDEEKLTAFRGFAKKLLG